MHTFFGQKQVDNSNIAKMKGWFKIYTSLTDCQSFEDSVLMPVCVDRCIKKGSMMKSCLTAEQVYPQYLSRSSLTTCNTTSVIT